MALTAVMIPTAVLAAPAPAETPETYANMPSTYVLKKHIHTLIAQETEKMDRELQS